MKANIGCLLLLLICACTARKEQTSQARIDSLRVQDSIAAVKLEEANKKDRALDALGEFIAGIHQHDSSAFSVLEKETSWKEYNISIDSNWSRVYNDRLQKIEKWEKEIFSSKLTDSLTIFYPFAGPDFLHVHYIYPHATEYIMTGLEPVMAPPALETVTMAYRNQFLDSLQHSLRDVFKKSFFITQTMAKDLKQVNGVVPILYFFIERTGHELLQQEFFYVDSTGNEIAVINQKTKKSHIPGVKLTFRDRQTHRVGHVRYLSIDLSNDSLKVRPEFEKFVKRNKPFNTFVKSASYLMHRPTFTTMRDIVLFNSESIFQDDTGIKYKDFRKHLEFNLTFFGEYIVPTIAFKNTRYQPDLDSAYKLVAHPEPLPFSMGYHWNTKKQNYMLLKRASMKPNR